MADITHTLDKLASYVWVSAINIAVIGSLWFVSPLGYAPITAYSGHIPSTPIDRSTITSGAISDDPVRIVIASLGIDLQILPGHYNQKSQTWNISDDAAQFATVSMPINTATGNTLIYGHNSKQVFWALQKMTPGAKAIITTAKGYTFTYQFEARKDVHPNDVSVFRFDGAPTLVLQTCTGNWNETRGMFSFALTGVVKG